MIMMFYKQSLVLTLYLGLNIWATPIYAQVFPLDKPLATSAIDTNGSRSAGLSQSWGRSSCVTGEQPLNALIPQQVVARTAEAYPTLFFHLPETSARYAILIVEDDKGKAYNEQIYPIEQEGGMVGLSWPADLPLAEGQTYSWRVVFACSRFAAPDDPNFRGQLQHISPDPLIAQTLANQSLAERAQWYQTQGYWHDLVSLFAADPVSQDLWASFLATYQVLPIPLITNKLVPVVP